MGKFTCNQYHKNNIYLSKNGEIPILDYINSKLSDGLYADNLRLERFDNKIVADIIDKNTHEKKSNFIIGYNGFNNDEEELFFMNNTKREVYPLFFLFGIEITLFLFYKKFIICLLYFI